MRWDFGNLSFVVWCIFVRLGSQSFNFHGGNISCTLGLSRHQFAACASNQILHVLDRRTFIEEATHDARGCRGVEQVVAEEPAAILRTRDIAAKHHRALVGCLRNEIEVVRGEQDGLARIGKLAEHARHVGFRNDVDALHRLVEQQHLGIEQDNLRKRRFLNLAPERSYGWRFS